MSAHSETPSPYAAAMVPVAIGAVVLIVLAVVVGLVTTWWLGALVVVAGLGAAYWWIRGAEARLMAKVSTRELDASEHPRLFNLVNNMCLTLGIDEPKVFVLESPGINAMVVGGENSPFSDGPNLVFTTAALEGLDLMELEGLAAHELVRARRGDGVAAVLCDAVARPLSLRSAPQRTLPDQPRLGADLDAVGITRYPPGLASVFQKVLATGAATGVDTGITGAFWAFAEHSAEAPIAFTPTSTRLAVLQEL